MAKRKKSGGIPGNVKGGFASVVMVLVIAGAVLGWANVNNIGSVADAYDYFKAHSDRISECTQSTVDWVCEDGIKVPHPTSPGDSTVPGNGTTPGGSNEPSEPTDTEPQPSDPVEPGVEPSTATERKDQMFDVLASIEISEPNEVDYNRSDWRHWTGSPCNTREDVLVRDGSSVTTDPKTCKVLSGSWVDPYTGEVFTVAGDLDIDHVIPLGYAARHGGNEWSKERKEQFANDMSQLLAVSASQNRSKSDKGPGSYMPASRDYHCEYADIWINTASKYDLSITEKDKVALTAAVHKCS